MEFKADLHCHTHFSDGSDSPLELMRHAKAVDLSALSITDHDTIDAYETAVEYARQEGIQLFPGIEFSAFFKEEAVHVLGYGMALDSESIRALCVRHRMRRLDRNRKILEKLKRLGIEIREEELQDPRLPSRTVGRPHLAAILVKRGIVSTLQEAFEKFLAEGRIAYVPGEPITVQETIEVIHDAKGKAILAHPHLIKRRSILRTLLALPFDGLEGYYARFPAEQNQEWVRLAQERNWIVTGGSDYHGKNKPMNILGSAWVDKSCCEKLFI